TDDLLLPKQTRYRAAPRPEVEGGTPRRKGTARCPHAFSAQTREMACASWRTSSRETIFCLKRYCPFSFFCATTIFAMRVATDPLPRSVRWFLLTFAIYLISRC